MIFNSIYYLYYLIILYETKIIKTIFKIDYIELTFLFLYFIFYFLFFIFIFYFILFYFFRSN